MKRFDGNSILIILSDRAYGNEVMAKLSALGAQTVLVSHIEEAIKILTKKEFDVVLSNYYLPDGLFLQLIDWCKLNLEALPIFTALDSGLPSDNRLMQRHFISGIFVKGDVERLLGGLHGLLFDFNYFYESLLAMVEERGIRLELIVGKEKTLVKPIEMTAEGIIFSSEAVFSSGAFGLLRISLFEAQQVESFVLIGSFGLEFSGGQHFKVNDVYEKSWHKLLLRLKQKQISITSFMERATGT